MNRFFRKLCALLAGMVWSAAPLAAQPRVPIDSIATADTTVIHAVVLQDGSKLVGRVVLVTADSLRIVSAVASTMLARSAVRSVAQYPVTSLRNGELWPENPHPTRLIFAPTAIPLRKGEGYISDFWVFFASAAVGVTDRFTIGGGLSLIPSDNFSNNIFYAIPKYTIVSGPTLNVAVGALAAILPGNGLSGRDPRSLGVLYGVVTKGSRESNITAGLGMGYVGGTLSDKPVLTLGAQHRMTRRVAFISENWLFPFDRSNEAFVSYGLRFLGEKVAVDFAFGTPLGSNAIFPGVPLLGFAFKF